MENLGNQSFLNLLIRYSVQWRVFLSIWIERKNGERTRPTSCNRTYFCPLKEVIRQSGMKNIFGGHSVRSASTSTAKKAGLSIDIILDMADWTSPSTFNLFYYKPTLPVSYGTSVLSQK